MKTMRTTQIRKWWCDECGVVGRAGQSDAHKTCVDFFFTCDVNVLHSFVRRHHDDAWDTLYRRVMEDRAAEVAGFIAIGGFNQFLPFFFVV